MHSLRPRPVPTSPDAPPGPDSGPTRRLGGNPPDPLDGHRSDPGPVTGDRLDALILGGVPDAAVGAGHGDPFPGAGPTTAPGGRLGTVPAGTGPGHRLSAIVSESGLGERFDAAVTGLDVARRRPLASAAVVVAIAVIAAGAWWLGRPPRSAPVELSIPLAASTTAATGSGTGAPAGAGGAGTAATDQPDELIVHVTGAVVHPGIVRLAPGDRVVDAVDAAGGPTADADLQRLNLAAPVDDGVQIRVPVPGEEVTALVVPTPGGGNSSGGADQVVALNRADAAELDRLPGIGPSLAGAIVEWRDEHGPFATVDGLLEVPGIGPAKLAALADQVEL